MLLLFDLRKPEGKSDEVIVEELEREASEMLGPWNREEYNSLVEICGGNIRLNRCLSEMCVEYEARPLPSGVLKRMIEPGNVGSEVLLKNSKGKGKAEEVGTSGGSAAVGTRVRGSLKPSIAKVDVKKAESIKRKALDQEVFPHNSGMPLFMEELLETVGGEIVAPEGALWLSLHDLGDEYGTILAGSSRRVEVAKALIALHNAPEAS